MPITVPPASSLRCASPEMMIDRALEYVTPHVSLSRTGNVTVTILDTAVSITFSRPMLSAGYEISLQAKSNVAVILWPTALTTNGFTLNLSVGVAATISYIAMELS